MHVIITSSYPVQKIEELQTAFLAAQEKYPPDENVAEQLTPILIYANDGLVNTTQIVKIKDGKLEDYLNNVYPLLWELSQVEGYKYDVQNAMSGEEAQALIKS